MEAVCKRIALMIPFLICTRQAGAEHSSIFQPYPYRSGCEALQSCIDSIQQSLPQRHTVFCKDDGVYYRGRFDYFVHGFANRARGDSGRMVDLNVLPPAQLKQLDAKLDDDARRIGEILIMARACISLAQWDTDVSAVSATMEHVGGFSDAEDKRPNAEDITSRLNIDSNEKVASLFRAGSDFHKRLGLIRGFALESRVRERVSDVVASKLKPHSSKGAYVLKWQPSTYILYARERGSRGLRVRRAEAGLRLDAVLVFKPKWLLPNVTDKRKVPAVDVPDKACCPWCNFHVNFCFQAPDTKGFTFGRGVLVAPQSSLPVIYVLDSELPVSLCLILPIKFALSGRLYGSLPPVYGLGAGVGLRIRWWNDNKESRIGVGVHMDVLSMAQQSFVTRTTSVSGGLSGLNVVVEPIFSGLNLSLEAGVINVDQNFSFYGLITLYTGTKKPPAINKEDE